MKQLINLEKTCCIDFPTLIHRQTPFASVDERVIDDWLKWLVSNWLVSFLQVKMLVVGAGSNMQSKTHDGQIFQHINHG